MSTTWWYQCESHDPPLAESFDGPYRTDLEKDLAPDRRSAINELPDFVVEHLYSESEVRHWWWLRLHKACKIAMVNDQDETIEQWNEKQRIADAQRLGLCTMPKCKLKLDHDGPCKP